MTTATMGPALTAAELAQAVRTAWTTRPGRPGLPPAGAFSDAFGDASAVADRIFDIEDFRATERDRLDELVHEAMVPVRASAETALLEAITTAVQAFAAEHPDAPRAHPEPVR